MTVNGFSNVNVFVSVASRRSICSTSGVPPRACDQSPCSCTTIHSCMFADSPGTITRNALLSGALLSLALTSAGSA